MSFTLTVVFHDTDYDTFSTVRADENWTTDEVEAELVDHAETDIVSVQINDNEVLKSEGFDHAQIQELFTELEYQGDETVRIITAFLTEYDISELYEWEDRNEGTFSSPEEFAKGYDEAQRPYVYETEYNYGTHFPAREATQMEYPSWISVDWTEVAHKLGDDFDYVEFNGEIVVFRNC